MNAQEYKRNYNWVIGLESIQFKFTKNNIVIDTLNNLDQKQFPFVYSFNSNSSISDTLGNLSFFSIGFTLYNSSGNYIKNGLDINSPLGNILNNFYGGISVFEQTDIIIPKKNNQYYVIGTGMSDAVADKYIQHIETKFDVLNYSIVDMDGNGGKGEVTVKNKIIAQNQNYSSTAITATKHANGKDWWLVKEDANNFGFQVFLVTEDTILGPYFQLVSQHGGKAFTLFSKINCSYDGSKICGNLYWDLDSAGNFKSYRTDVYNFDRCSGSINDFNTYYIPLDTSSFKSWDHLYGSNFSPDSKLLYINSFYNIWQVNMANDNIQHIHGMDTIESRFPWYNMIGIGANGKMYVGNQSGMRKYMSYIDKPNEIGLACDFKAQGVWQPFTNLMCPPNMPNYGLGALAGSACDTIRAVPQNWLLYPNPASNNIAIKIPNSKQGASLQLQVYNLLGQKIIDKQVLISVDYEAILDVASLARSIYIIKAKYGNEEFISKFVKE